MSITVFYSWQSDRDKKTNRNFLKNALEKAIARVGKPSHIKESLRLDQDTQGVPGSPDVFNTILSKIDECGIFVADLTFVGRTPQGKKMPNPNVLLEYGYALKSLGDARIIQVMNEKYGDAEQLPFDLKRRRWPIGYRLAPNASADTRKKAKTELTKKLETAIGTIIEAGLLKKKQKHVEFQETPPVFGSSSFLEDGDILASMESGHRQWEVLWYNRPQAYLRLLPTKGVTSRTSMELRRLVTEERLRLSPLGDTRGVSIGRNKHGVVLFETVDQEGTKTADCITQLFENGEIWGIDGFVLGYDNDRRHIDIEYIERVFLQTLENYLQFAQDSLEHQTPLKVIAGLEDIEDYRLMFPPALRGKNLRSLSERCAKSEVTHEAVIEDYSEPVDTILLPFFEKIWSACGLERPGMK